MEWNFDNKNPFGYSQGLYQGDILGSGLLNYANKAKNEIGLLFNPEYMKQIKPMSNNEAIDIALNVSPLALGTLKVPALQEAAKSHFGTTFYPKETGYIMDDLSRLDFTGRHNATGYRNIAGRYIPESGKPDYLKMGRNVDHREVSPLLPKDTESGWQSLSKFMDDTGAIRYDSDYGISLVNTNKPNRAQIEKVVNDFKKSKTPLLIDIDKTSNGANIASKEFENPNIEDVLKWINKQYKNN